MSTLLLIGHWCYISPVLEPLNILYHETHDCSQIQEFLNILKGFVSGSSIVILLQVLISLLNLSKSVHCIVKRCT